MSGTERLVAIFCLLLPLGPFGRAEAGARLSPAMAEAMAEAMADIQKTLAQVRGHPFLAAVPVATINRSEVRAFLLEKLKRDYPDERIEAERKAYVHLGFLAAGDDLKTLFIQLLVEQAAGFYDPDEKRLFLVSGRSFPGIALAHELAHALQDQTFGVSAIIDRARDNDDELLAVQSMIEGEAMSLSLSSKYASMRPGQEQLPDADAAVSGSAEAEQDRPEESGRMPRILQETLMFPYTLGASWANDVVRTGGQAMMDQMFRHPPESSEQILHPEKTQPPRDLPSLIDHRVLGALDSTLLGAGYRSVKINTLGEFDICLLFGGRGDPQALETASGWDGDLYEIAERAGAGTAMIWISVWDSAADAAEFRVRATAWLRERHPGSGAWRVGVAERSNRIIWILEGFDTALGDRLEASLPSALAAGVTLR